MGFDMSLDVSAEVAEQIENSPLFSALAKVEHYGDFHTVWSGCSWSRDLWDALVSDHGAGGAGINDSDYGHAVTLDKMVVGELVKLRQSIHDDAALNTMLLAASVAPGVAASAWEELPALARATVAAMFRLKHSPATGSELFSMMTAFDDTAPAVAEFLDAVWVLHRINAPVTITASW